MGNGRLEGGVELPTVGANFRPYSSLGTTLGRTYVHSTAAKGRRVGIALVIFDAPFLPELFATPRGPYLREHLKFMKGRPWVRHDEHYHVDFDVPCKPLAG